MEHFLRVTYKNSDYTFKLIKNAPVTRDTTEFQIMLNGVITTICKDIKGWIQKESTVEADPELVDAIGKTLSLRFRLQ
jgi:hypothetical protein